MLSMFRRLLVSALMVAFIVPNVPLFAAHARVGQPETGTISGTARSAAGVTMPNVTVRLRNVQTGQLVATTRSSGQGEFTFKGLPAGNYTVEIANDRGEVVGASAPVLLSAQTMAATDLAVTASAVGQAGAVAGAGSGAFFATTAGIVTIAAVAAGVVGVVVAADKADASPSR
jgi:hypothetical protein